MPYFVLVLKGDARIAQVFRDFRPVIKEVGDSLPNALPRRLLVLGAQVLE